MKIRARCVAFVGQSRLGDIRARGWQVTRCVVIRFNQPGKVGTGMPTEPGLDHGLSRRSVLAAGVAAVAGLAGCAEQLTNHEFEAAPVQLPASAQEEFLLAESAVDSSTVTREPSVAGVDGEVTITSHVAAYRRGPARGTHTLMEAFLSQANGTPGAGGAAVVPGSALDVETLAMPVFEEEPTISGSDWSLVVPAGTRGDGEISLEGTMVLVPGTAIPAPAVTPRAAWVAESQRISGTDWFPRSQWVPPTHQWSPGSTWVPGVDWVPDNPASLEVLLMRVGEIPGPIGPLFDLEGADYNELPGRPLDDGETIETENAVIAVPGSDVFNPEGAETPFSVPHPGGGQPIASFNSVLESGLPAPTGGATYGLGVLSTPAAEIAGQSVNPVGRMEVEEVLTHERAQDFLGAVLEETVNKQGVSWRSDPVASPPRGHPMAPPDHNPLTVLGQEIERETFFGILSGDDGPWGVAIHLGRIQADGDIVIAAATQATPVNEEIPPSLWLDNPDGTTVPMTNWLRGGVELTAASAGALQHGALDGG